MCCRPEFCAVGIVFVATFEVRAILGLGEGAGAGILVTGFDTAGRDTDARDGAACLTAG